MKKQGKVVQSRRKVILQLVRDRPGITTNELSVAAGFANAKLVSNAMWALLKNGSVLAERIERDGRHINAYYMPDQVDGNSVARVRQRIVDATDVIPPATAVKGTINSVFNGPRAPVRSRKKPVRRKVATTTSNGRVNVEAHPKAVSFSCAVANDGSLILMRGGRIELSLTDDEAIALRNYLVKRAAVDIFANMV